MNFLKTDIISTAPTTQDFTRDLVENFNDPFQLLIILGISTALGIIIASTYHKTHRGFSYSQSFSITLILMTVITTLIIVLIGDNIARAVGVFGAFSIVRFRTAIKDPRDTVFVFFALAAGLAIGSGSFIIGMVGTLAIALLIFMLHFTNFGGIKKLDYVLSFKMEAKHHVEEIFNGLFAKYLRSRNLLNVESKDKGKYMFFTFNIRLINEDSMKEFLKELNDFESVTDVNIVSSKNDLEF